MDYLQYLLILVGAVAGYELGQRRLNARRIAADRATRVLLAVICGGVVGAFLLPVALDYLANDWRQESDWNFQPGGLSSVWGFVTATFVAMVVCLSNAGVRRDLSTYLGALAFAFPFAWIPVRLACSTLHHHAGAVAAADIPAVFVTAGRLDLGRLELALTLAIAALFAASVVGFAGRVTPRVADRFYVGTVLVSFGLFRGLSEHTRIDVRPLVGDLYAAEIAALFGFCVVTWLLAVTLYERQEGARRS